MSSFVGLEEERISVKETQGHFEIDLLFIDYL